MNPFVINTARRLNQEQCNIYGAGANSGFSGIAASVASVASGANPSSAAPGVAVDINNFARRVFIHGVPYQEALKFGQASIPILKNMLKDKSAEPHWSNAAIIVGMIGDENAVSILTDFIERDVGKISPAHYRAKTSAVISLGYLVNKTGDLKALEYLVSGIDPKVWSARIGENNAPYLKTLIERNHDFSRKAMIGLALSGHPMATKALKSIQQPTNDPTVQKFRSEVAKQVADMLEEHEKVSTLVLAKYYGSEP